MVELQITFFFNCIKKSLEIIFKKPLYRKENNKKLKKFESMLCGRLDAVFGILIHKYFSKKWKIKTGIV